MFNMCEPLELVPVERWYDLKNEFKKDFPRGMSGYTLLDTEEGILNNGIDYGFRVYCPHGVLSNGLVGINKKSEFYEVIILCPNDDTSELENALRHTRLIDWSQSIEIPFAPKHITDLYRKIMAEKSLVFDHLTTTETFYLDDNAPYYDITLPPDSSFRLLTMEYIKLVNETWPHRYNSSQWYFELLIKAKLGYGLFLNNDLVAWCFVKEMGALGHLYTVEQHRRKGYGELVLKLMANTLREQGKYVLAYCSVGNVNARKMYVKAGFTLTEAVEWNTIKPKAIED